MFVYVTKREIFMDKMTFCKRFMAMTAVVVAVVMLILGLCFGKVIEANLFEEVMKWVVGTVGIIVIVEVMAYSISQFVYDAWVRPKVEKKEDDAE